MTHPYLRVLNDYILVVGLLGLGLYETTTLQR